MSIQVTLQFGDVSVPYPDCQKPIRITSTTMPVSIEFTDKSGRTISTNLPYLQVVTPE